MILTKPLSLDVIYALTVFAFRLYATLASIQAFTDSEGGRVCARGILRWRMPEAKTPNSAIPLDLSGLIGSNSDPNSVLV